MKLHANSLSVLAHAWRGSNENVRITRVPKSRDMPWRVVRVEVVGSSGTFTIVFFRHGLGLWCVYPPPTYRPSMAVIAA